tara:strand:+ start:5898 stop:6797 length:900 start_codon:yes stop_codon:yes gene_type:complete
MTFDARGGKPPASKNNALFAIAVVAVVGGAFLVALKFPGASKADSTSTRPQTIVATAEAPSVPTPAGWTSEAATTYFQTLSRVDPGASASLNKRLAKASRKPQPEQSEVVFEHAADLLKRHAADLARADTRHVDAILVMTRDRLRSASQSGSPWCQGSKFADLDQATLANKAALNRELKMLEEPLRDYGLELVTRLLIAIEDAQAHPVNHGTLTQTDKAAMQGVMMSMVSDPQVMPLLMAAQTGGNPDELVKSLNVCDLGATAVIAIKTLPQDTKGRAFADMVRQMELGGGDLTSLSQF